MPAFSAPPRWAAWRHVAAREGFEVVFFERLPGGGLRLVGSTTAVEDDEAWLVGYSIDVDDGWATRSARIESRSSSGARQVTLVSSRPGEWLVDGVPTPDLDGCVDVDLESSAMTNTLPVHRLDVATGELVAAPAAYVRVPDLRVERLEQTYRWATSADDESRFDYTAPAFGVACVLSFDGAGLVQDYPGIATRVA
ncbi:MAG: putative glycolipid-binding domain-containing protein [Candidatus Nanopelagicales bacterium]